MQSGAGDGWARSTAAESEAWIARDGKDDSVAQQRPTIRPRALDTPPRGLSNGHAAALSNGRPRPPAVGPVRTAGHTALLLLPILQVLGIVVILSDAPSSNTPSLRGPRCLADSAKPPRRA